MQEDCFLLLGTNLGSKHTNLSTAINMIKEKIGSVAAISGIYESEPWGYEDSNSYLNQGIQVKTTKNAQEVLLLCLEIEKEMGRVRAQSGYEARPIDIDIIFYGQHILETEALVIPHPRMQDRKFVLFPLEEITTGFVHPILGKTISELKQECQDKGWVKKVSPDTV